MHLAGVDDVKAEVVFGGGADADLHRPRGVHEAGFHRLVHHRAVVDPGQVVVGPEVGVRVEMDDRQRAEPVGIGAQDRQGDVVVAAQRDAARPCGEDACDVTGQRLREVRGLGVVECAVAIVDDVHVFQWVGRPAIGRVIGHQRACLADCAGTEPGAGAVRHRLIEGHAGDGQIDAGQVLGVGAAQETRRPTERVFEGIPPLPGPGEGGVGLGLCVFKGQGSLLFRGIGWQGAG